MYKYLCFFRKKLMYKYFCVLEKKLMYKYFFTNRKLRNVEGNKIQRETSKSIYNSTP